MVRDNNCIIKNHFHKKWQIRIKTRFDQPIRKLVRHKLRLKVRLTSFPRPVSNLRSIVHCPSVQYNKKVRLGRGFTLDELKTAGINKKLAPAIGISVDYRRRNKSLESLKLNVHRLKEYRSKLILSPKNGCVVKYTQNLPKVQRTEHNKLKAYVPSEEEKRFQAFAALSKARNELKRLKKAMKKSQAVTEI